MHQNAPFPSLKRKIFLGRGKSSLQTPPPRGPLQWKFLRTPLLSVRPVIVAIGNVFSSTASVTDVLFGTHRAAYRTAISFYRYFMTCIDPLVRYRLNFCTLTTKVERYTYIAAYMMDRKRHKSPVKINAA